MGLAAIVLAESRSDVQMSSNLNSVRTTTQTPRRILARALDFLRNLVGGDRFENLYGTLAAELNKLKVPGAEVKLLDYGCGTMSFSERLQQDGHIASFMGMDTYPAPDNAAGTKWAYYRQIPGDGIDESAGRFDVAIVLDVLHHASVADQVKILRSLARMSRHVLVKDHFEYGFFSRQILRLADWYGNYAYGVNVPDRYFDQETWRKLVEQAQLKELKLLAGVRVHDGLFGLILPPRHHFISVLTLP
jgi:hypothetical protein